MELINNVTKTLRDDLSEEIKQGSKLSIAAAVSYTHLDVYKRQGHKDMKYLSISSNPVTDISFIQEMKELELFHLDDTWVEDLSVLKEMKGIKELGISKNLLKTEKDKELVSHIERVLER